MSQWRRDKRSVERMTRDTGESDTKHPGKLNDICTGSGSRTPVEEDVLP